MLCQKYLMPDLFLLFHVPVTLQCFSGVWKCEGIYLENSYGDVMLTVIDGFHFKEMY
jgi:hypothetical protein